MNDTLKKRLRLSYRKWERTCDHCGRAKKERAMKDFTKACSEAIAYANTLAIPKEYGELRLATVYFPRNIASWSKGSGGEGILQGDTWDGGPVSWYWLLPRTQPHKDSDPHWHRKPGDALIDLVEHMEKAFGFAPIVPPPDPTAEFTTIEQVVDHLLTKGVANKIRGSLFDQLFQFHNNLGRNIRNDYKLWERPHLVRACCVGRAQAHPDEASMAILEALWCQVNTPG